MSGYIGNIPVPAATQTRDTFTATAGQTTFATSGYTPSFLDVFLNGVHLVNGTDYTATNGSDVVLTSGAAAGDTLEVVAYSTFEPADVTASSGFTVTGNLSVDGGTIKLDGNYPVGTNNVALGNAALDSNVSGASNTAIGADALTANTASGNTAVGYQAAYSNTTGAENVLVGYKTGYSSTTANGLTALGRQALEDNTASNNTAIGFAVLANNTTGTFNTALGGANYGFTGGAMHLNTTGSYNTALGNQALHNNTTANNNTAVGYKSLFSNTTGNANTSVGFEAGLALTTGVYNTYLGIDAGKSNTVSDHQTFLGRFSGTNTTGAENTFVGSNSGYLVTTGSKNTIIGRYSGNANGLDIRTATNYIVLSNGDGTPRGHFDNIGNWCVGGPYANPPSTYSFAQMTRTGILQSGRTGTGNQPAAEFFNGNGVVGSIYTNGSSTSFNTSSDYRLKENVVELTGATDRLKQIPVHRFNFTTDPDTTVDGFLAHEVQAIVPEAITGEHNEVDTDGNPVYQGIDQSKLVPLLVATIKELEARIAALEAN